MVPPIRSWMGMLNRSGRREATIVVLCRREGIAQNLCYRWSKNFLEAGKKRLAGDFAHEASSNEVKCLRAEVRQLTETLSVVILVNKLLKKSVIVAASLFLLVMGKISKEILHCPASKRSATESRPPTNWQLSASSYVISAGASYT